MSIVVFLVIMWPIGSALGWLSVQDLRPNRPLNWRVFLGPAVYGRWNERRMAERG